MSEKTPDLRQEKFIKMTTQPVEKLVLRLSVPTIASMLVTAAYNLADTYFVSAIPGHTGTCAIAAVSLAFSVMAILQAFGFFVGQGASNFISRALGRQEVDKASEMAATGLFCSLLVGVLLGGIGEIFIKPIAGFLGAKGETLQPTVDYLRWIFLAAPFVTGSFCLNNQLRFQGNAVYAMIGVVSGAVLNVGLDPLLIHVFGMGAGGAALATAISQTVGFFVLLAGTFRGDNLRIHPRRIRLSGENLKNIVKGGLPSLLRQGFAAVSVMLLNLVAGRLGDQTAGLDRETLIAAFGLVSKIMTTAAYVIIGLGQGYQPVCGFNYGAGLYGRVRRAFWFLVAVTAVWSVLITVFGELFPYQVIDLFKKAEPQVKELAAQILRLQCATFFINCWVVPSNMTEQTIGWTASASLLAMARQGLFLIPLVLTLPNRFGVPGLELCQPVSDILALLLAIPLQIRVLRHLKQEVPNEAADQ